MWGWKQGKVAGTLLLVTVWLVGCGTNAASSHPGNAATIPGQITTRSQSYQSALDAFVARFVNGMSLDDRIGQMLYAQFAYNDCGDPNPCIQHFHPGGMIVYQNQLDTMADSIHLTSSAQASSVIPMLIGTDNEGGAEDRLVNVGPRHLSAFALSQLGSATAVYNYGKAMAKDNLAVGLNVDLAPVVDINPYGSDRDFGTTPASVIKYAGAWMQGLQDGGVIGTLKHFPGLGGTNLDPHSTLPTINKSKQDIEQFDLAPYRALISSSDPPGMIMSTDIMVPSVDPNNVAELSYPIITGILRNELHYDGVVITDALYMGGLGLFFTNGKDAQAARQPALLTKIAILAIKAGDDMLLGTYNYPTTQAVIAGIKAAIASGDLTEARINQSVTRIIRLKVMRGLIPFNPNPGPGAPAPQFAMGAMALPASRGV